MVVVSVTWKAKIEKRQEHGLVLRGDDSYDRTFLHKLLVAKHKGKIYDKHLSFSSFRKGNRIQVTIRNVPDYHELFVQPHTKETNKSIAFYGVVNEIIRDGFSLKLLVEGENLFEKTLSFQERGHLTDNYVLDEDNNPYEIGDVVFVEIQKVS